MLLWIFFVVFVIFLYVTLIKPYFYWKERNVPYKTPFPLVGNMGPVVLRLKTMADNLDEFYNGIEGRYKGFYGFLKPMLMVKDVELIKQITVKDFDSFLDHRDIIPEELEPLFGRALFLLKGEFGLRSRSSAIYKTKKRTYFLYIFEFLSKKHTCSFGIFQIKIFLIIYVNNYIISICRLFFL